MSQSNHSPADSTGRPSEHEFRFLFEPRYRGPARFFGVTEKRARITIEDGQLRVRFGPWFVSTPLSNIAAVELTGPYAYPKTAGPAHLGLTDRGLTFATNSWRGVLITFHEPITGMDPLGWLRHPELTVTPSDPALLERTLHRCLP